MNEELARIAQLERENARLLHIIAETRDAALELLHIIAETRDAALEPPQDAIFDEHMAAAMSFPSATVELVKARMEHYRAALETGEAYQTVLEVIARKAPQSEPPNSISASTLPMVWSFWIAGNMARKVLCEQKFQPPAQDEREESK
jgi:hypothetical protein